VKILVAFKRVPDASAPEKWVVNPFDEIAIEEAVRMRERGEAKEIVGVTVGCVAADEQARIVFALGVDRVIRVDDDRPLDPYAVARLLKGVVSRESPDVIIMGKQAVDDDSSQVGQMLAGLLRWPQATFVSNVEFVNGAKQARCTRETDRGLEIIMVQLPAVITVDLRLNEPRYVSLHGLMKARRRSIEVQTCHELGVDVQPRTTVIATMAAPRRCAGIKVASVDELLSYLQQGDKVL
jgi:electron transfer flavoprotein beta subunit